jgi:DNA-binding CsgD family transcriptional regulator
VVSSASSLFERLMGDAQGASGIADFRKVLGSALLRFVGADSAAMIDPLWLDSDRQRARESLVGIGSSAGFAEPFAMHRRRYARSFARMLRAVRSGAPVVDLDVYGARERERLAVYREIFLPQRASSVMMAAVRLGTAAMVTVVFKRHGRTSAFGAAEKSKLQAILPTIALADTCFRCGLSARPAACPAPPFLDSGLGAREAQVAALASRGLRNAEIAALLGTSVETVKKQLRRVFAKVDVANRTELAMLCAGSPSSP